MNRSHQRIKAIAARKTAARRKRRRRETGGYASAYKGSNHGSARKRYLQQQYE